jgi:hypothetical protein
MEGIVQVGAGHTLALLASLGRDAAARVGEARQAWLGRFQSKVRLGRLG